MKIVTNKILNILPKQWYKIFSSENEDFIDKDNKLYWGKQASGILLIKLINNQPYFHVTQRSEHVYDPHVWGPPGGAVPSNQDLLESAIRETEEEIGDFPVRYKVLDKHVWQSPTGNFKYTTFVVFCLDNFDSKNYNWEVADSGWYPEKTILHLDLHPAFREVLLKILPKLKQYKFH